jgi:hypothetical protein
VGEAADLGEVADEAGGAQVLAGSAAHRGKGEAEHASLTCRGLVVGLQAAEGRALTQGGLHRLQQGGGAGGGVAGLGAQGHDATEDLAGVQPGRRGVAQNGARGGIGLLHQTGGTE